MTRYDQKILFTALAFMAIVTKEGDKLEADSVQKIMQLAGLLGEFCIENVPPVVHRLKFGGDSDAAELDLKIERHVAELRAREETHLPEDKDTLLKYYDRLQQRKSRRMQREFYAQVTAELLADKVLNYLDEEIEDAEALS